MGSGLSKMYDDYEDYEYICKKLGEKITRSYTDFLSHQYMILTKHGYKDKYDLFEKNRKQKERDNKLNNLGIN
jgi:hypothetical protein